MDAISLYKKLAVTNSVLLDSSRNDAKERYSIIGFDPFLVIESKGDKIVSDGEGKDGNPFEELERLLTMHKTKKSTNPLFDGLAIGYFGYELVHFIETLPRTTKDDMKVPDMRFGFYKDYIVIDHFENKIHYIGDKDKIKRKLEENKERLNQTGKTSEVKSNFTKEGYIRAIQKVKQYIEKGDTFQVNLSQRFQMETTSDALHIYEHLARRNPSHFGAYLDFGEVKLICSSPERLVKLDGRRAWTRPIAGTRPRGKTKKEDKKLEEELKINEKELAEHWMLVDLERNDLGKVCEFGSVKVDEALTIEKYSHVMHLVSEVSGTLRKGVSNVDLIKAMFPGGTITGCPKPRTMEIIDELEPTARGPYTGALGYFSLSGDCDFNMIIRTIVMKGKKAYVQVGGGIVYDSIPEKEYDETINKGNALFEVLNAKVR